MKGRRPGGETEPATDAEGEGLASPDEETVPEPPGELLGLVIVVPNGVGPGGTDAPGRGVAVAGTAVGLGVGRTVGRGVGPGVGGGGTGVGEGAVTTTCPGTGNDGFVPKVLTE